MTMEAHMRALTVALILTAFPLSSYGQTPFALVIQRNYSCNHGEAGGSLLIGGTEVARTLELPWKDNLNDVSRVPPGRYAGTVRDDGPRGWRIALKNVPNRNNVQLHVGNFPRDTTGCVLVGRTINGADGTCAVMQSTGALADVRSAMAKASDNGVSSQPLDITVEIRD